MWPLLGVGSMTNWGFGMRKYWTGAEPIVAVAERGITWTQGGKTFTATIPKFTDRNGKRWTVSEMIAHLEKRLKKLSGSGDLDRAGKVAAALASLQPAPNYHQRRGIENVQKETRTN